jgi:hypothetical protein
MPLTRQTAQEKRGANRMVTPVNANIVQITIGPDPAWIGAFSLESNQYKHIGGIGPGTFERASFSWSGGPGNRVTSRCLLKVSTKLEQYKQADCGPHTTNKRS